MCDPPYAYLGDTRGTAKCYRQEMRSEVQHRELAEAVTGALAHVVVCAYPSTRYDDLYGGWHRYELAAATQQGATSGNDTKRLEVLYSNRPLLAATPLF